jgi:hypothetical protein
MQRLWCLISSVSGFQFCPITKHAHQGPDGNPVTLCRQNVKLVMSPLNVGITAIYPFEAERERERASFLLEGSQATPARPSGRNNVKVKTLW